MDLDKRNYANHYTVRFLWQTTHKTGFKILHYHIPGGEKWNLHKNGEFWVTGYSTHPDWPALAQDRNISWVLKGKFLLERFLIWEYHNCWKSAVRKNWSQNWTERHWSQPMLKTVLQKYKNWEWDLVRFLGIDKRFPVQAKERGNIF